MFFRRIWRVILIVIHLLMGYGAFFRAGGKRQPFHPAMRDTMRRWYERMLEIMNVEITVIGTIPHESSGAVMMIANHISWVDIPLIGSQTPVNFLSKAEVAKWPVVGSLAERIGTLFISRGSGDTEQVMQAMAQHLNNKLSVLFFPEGTTTYGDKVRRFHKKLFKVCETTDVSVCPLLIRYQGDGESNPVPFVGDIGFGTHLWELLGHKKIWATVEVLPQVKLDPETVGHQIREIELMMREKVAAKESPALPN